MTVNTLQPAGSPTKSSPGEALNVDPVLLAIMDENRIVQLTHAPLFTFTPSSDPTSLLPIIAACDLGQFHRHPASEKIYRGQFRTTVMKRYGPMEVYLRQRLGWLEEDASDTVADEETGEQEYFRASDREGTSYKVARNEWPYALPPDVTHICVWTRRPLLHRSLASSDAEWDSVSSLGLGGFSGLPPSLLASVPPSSTAPTSALEAQGTCAQEIAAFVERRWKPEEGWTTAWFVNPPPLQSVKGLSHFHVFAKRW